MTYHGSIGSFSPLTDDWASHDEYIELYFTVNGLESDGKESVIFLTICGYANVRYPSQSSHHEGACQIQVS